MNNHGLKHIINKNRKTVQERLEWLKNHPPKGYKPHLGWTWKRYVEEIVIGELYSYAFNNPIYCGPSGLTDDEARHEFLDTLNIPK